MGSGRIKRRERKGLKGKEERVIARYGVYEEEFEGPQVFKLAA
jgi:hypothetical protein